MKIGFPIKKDRGLDSDISDHFGISKEFMIVDSVSNNFEIMENQKLSEEKAACKSHQLSGGAKIDIVITKCIGNGSLRNLNAAKIIVLQAVEGTIKENLRLYNNNELSLFHIFDVCREERNKKDHKGCGHH